MGMFGFYKTKKMAIKVGRKLKKPVYKCRSGYFVGSKTSKLLRLNIKDQLKGKTKKIR